LLDQVDCTTTCSVLDTSAALIQYNKRVAQVLLPPSFHLSFEVLGPRLTAPGTSDGENIVIDFVDVAASILSVHISEIEAQLTVWYDGSPLSNPAPGYQVQLIDEFRMDWTAFNITVNSVSNTIAISTSYNRRHVETYAINSLAFAESLLGADPMWIYTSSSWGPSSGGYVRNIKITGKIEEHAL
jgi:hypothetical protein